ncbi:MAG TPA: VWA domain-containing protein [Blastocatellia bacterium]
MNSTPFRSAAFVTLAVVAALLLALAGRSSGQMPHMSHVQDEPIGVRSGNVSMEVSVSDRTGNSLKSLTEKDFAVYEDGVKQRIVRFSQTQAPFNVMLLLDLSGSTEKDIDLMKSASDEFVSDLRAGERVAVATFSNGGQMVADFQDDRKETKRKIAGISIPAATEGERYTVDSGTSFYDALDFAIKSSPLAQVEGRKALVCITDGVDSSSTLKYSDVAGELRKSNTTLYFLALDTEKENLNLVLKDPSDRDYANFSRSQLNRYFDRFEPDPYAPDRQIPRNELSKAILAKINAGLYEIARQQMAQMAEHTGGKVYPVNGVADLPAAFKQVITDLRAQYSIEYHASNPAHDGLWRAIRVEVDVPGAIVHARSGYLASAQEFR